MKRKSSKFLSLLLAAVLLLSLIAPAALAAGTADTIYLRTAEDLAGFSRNCTLDSWSQGRIVRLQADIDLSGTDFTPIPTFGGTFEGQGHTISGLSITGSGNVRGLFRYIQPSGVVRDLSVEGRVDPSDRKNTLGGIAGSNRGLLAGCTFHGTVRGADSIGGLVGINESSGQIVNCTFSGAVTGEHYAGGIAGQNYGAVIQCRNSGSINTTEVDAELDLDAINREQLNAAENVPVCTDIGGVAGYSSGIIQSCTNSGSVGYDHVGYNIGGIVGRQSGYLDGCANSGDILGRKDVGGVAGQLEPEVRLLYDQGQMGELLDALDGLGDLLDQTQQDVLHVVAHVARLSKGGGVGDGEGHLQHPGQSLGKQSLAAASGAHEQDVALLQLHILAAAEENALIVVVYRHRQSHLGILLPDDVLIQAFLDLRRGHDVDVQVVSGLQAAGTARTCTRCTAAGRTLRLVGKQVVAQADALTADVDAGADDHAFHFVLVLSTEAADQILLVFVSAGIVICHSCFSLSWINWCQRNDQRWVMTSSISPYSFASSADI